MVNKLINKENIIDLKNKNYISKSNPYDGVNSITYNKIFNKDKIEDRLFVEFENGLKVEFSKKDTSEVRLNTKEDGIFEAIYLMNKNENESIYLVNYDPNSIVYTPEKRNFIEIEKYVENTIFKKKLIREEDVNHILHNLKSEEKIVFLKSKSIEKQLMICEV